MKTIVHPCNQRTLAQTLSRDATQRSAVKRRQLCLLVSRQDLDQCAVIHMTLMNHRLQLLRKKCFNLSFPALIEIKTLQSCKESFINKINLGPFLLRSKKTTNWSMKTSHNRSTLFNNNGKKKTNDNNLAAITARQVSEQKLEERRRLP